MDSLGHIFNQDPLLKKIINFREIQTTLEANWDSIFGKLASEMKLIFIKNSAVFISTNNPLWANEMLFFKEEILQKINGILEKKFTKKCQMTAINIRFVADDNLEKKPKKQIKNTPKKSQLSLEQLINEDNNTKKKQGLLLCSKCKSVYTNTPICVFCHSEQNRIET